MAGMDVAMYLESGRKYIEEKDVARAIENLTTAVQMDPSCDEAYYLRSKAYYVRAVNHKGIVNSAIRRKGDDDKAIADIRMATKLAPENEEYVRWLKAILDDIGYGYGITISGRTLDPSAEIKKRRKVLMILVVVALVISLIVGGVFLRSFADIVAVGLAVAIVALIYGIGIVPWLVSVKRNILDIPGYFKITFGAGLDSFEGGITGIIKSFFMALLITLFWKPFKLACLFNISPIIGLFQMVELLRERKKSGGKS